MKTNHVRSLFCQIRLGAVLTLVSVAMLRGEAGTVATATHGAGQVAPNVPANTPPVSIATALDSTVISGQINGTHAAARQDLINRVEKLVEASGRSLDELRGATRNLKDEDRRRFDAAYEIVQTRAEALHQSIVDARQSLDTTWSLARNNLSSDYRMYALAVAEAEVSARAASAGPVTLPP